MRYGRKLALRAIGAAALLSGIGAQAGAQTMTGCWQQAEVEAAQIRQFDIMLMVSALRCQVKGVDFVSEYNGFVISNRTTLVAANDLLLRHFNAGLGGRAALDAYDRLSTGMANHFGNGGGMSEDCAVLRAMALAAATSDREQLIGHAQRAGMDPAMPGERCAAAAAVTIAKAATTAPVALAVASATPAAVAAVATMTEAASDPEAAPRQIAAAAPVATPAIASSVVATRQYAMAVQTPAPAGYVMVAIPASQAVAAGLIPAPQMALATTASTTP